MLRSTKFLPRAGKERLLCCLLVVVSVCLLIPSIILVANSQTNEAGLRDGSACPGGFYPT
jgi:hypothetical protein